eukprot:CAMPEP_0176439384 /NCGR_PEP_ID=MMETSP0127-20121128/19909_1 /TAXON_ID=938130 /ORGANISM="Platyophrya macrostoma, Strain WH" /LENGTH=300 /DNA_ID=CAMNT_0017823639 /DNA_START=53 /DNA_END=955 /DNA_ORIENTATION=+
MGIYLPTPNREKVSEDDKNGKMRYGASSMQGWRVNMEDSHIAKFNIAPDVHIFGVFDGHGGKEVALFVERHFIAELLSNENFKKGIYDKALTETFLRMDELLVTPEGRKEINILKNGDDGKGYQPESFAGCTANVALIAKGELIVANAGDSRCIISSKGVAIEMSEDHKPELPRERERVQKAGGYISEGRINGNLNLSRALGDLEYKKNTELGPGEQLISSVPEIKRRMLTADDEFIVIGCDGIWETLSNQSIAEFMGQRIYSATNISKAIEEFLDKILAPDTMGGVGCDNMTCVVIQLK